MCALKHGRADAAKITATLRDWFREGNSAVLVTLAPRRDPNAPLAALWDAVDADASRGGLDVQVVDRYRYEGLGPYLTKQTRLGSASTSGAQTPLELAVAGDLTALTEFDTASLRRR